LLLGIDLLISLLQKQDTGNHVIRCCEQTKKVFCKNKNSRYDFKPSQKVSKPFLRHNFWLQVRGIYRRLS